MVFSNHFVVCILIDGKPVQELANGTVPIPFGSQYSIRLRNKNKRRAVAKIILDGENVSDKGYVVNADSYVDIHRHADRDVAFKFVSLNSPDAVDFGKNGPNDDKVKGTVRVEFYLEKERKTPQVTEIHHHHYDYWPKPWRPNIWLGGGVGTAIYGSSSNSIGSNSIGSSGFSGSLSRSCVDSSSMPLSSASINAVTACDQLRSAQANPTSELKDGCTVEGSMTGQSFGTVWIDTEDTCTSICLFLQGFDQQVHVRIAPKSKKLLSLEEENEKMRERLAELENKELKKKLSKYKSKK